MKSSDLSTGQVELVRDAETDQTNERPAKPTGPQAIVGASELAELLMKERVERAPVVLENGSLMPKDMDGMWRIATAYNRSGLGPRDKNGEPLPVADLFGILSAGYSLGLNDSQAMSSMLIVNGRPGLFGDMPLALIRKSGKLKLFREEMQQDGTWICTVQRVEDAHPMVRHFTREMAEKAGLLRRSGPWTNYPQRMFQFRSRAWALRDAAPDVLLGVAIQEEYEGVELDQRSPSTPPTTATPTRGSAAEALAGMEVIKPQAQQDAAPAAKPVEVIDQAPKSPKPTTAREEAEAIVELYHFDPQVDTDVGFVASCRELKGVMADGRTAPLAVTKAKLSAIEALVKILETGGTPPQPIASPNEVVATRKASSPLTPRPGAKS